MSAIASFYLVRDADVDRLKDLAVQPVGPGARGQWQDLYWEFLHTYARELEQYEWSGYVKLDVSAFLASRSARIDEHCDGPLSDFFSKARENNSFVFRPVPGKALAQLIVAIMPDHEAQEAFLASPEMVSVIGDDTPREGVLDGLRILRSWLSQLDEGHVGLLSIG